MNYLKLLLLPLIIFFGCSSSNSIQKLNQEEIQGSGKFSFIGIGENVIVNGKYYGFVDSILTLPVGNYNISGIYKYNISTKVDGTGYIDYNTYSTVYNYTDTYRTIPMEQGFNFNFEVIDGYRYWVFHEGSEVVLNSYSPLRQWYSQNKANIYIYPLAVLVVIGFACGWFN